MKNVDFEVDGLTFTYPEETKPALDHVSFRVRSGEFILLTGKSGSGKTTLLRSLKPSLAFEGQYDGSLRIFGKSPEEISLHEDAEKIGFVLQNPYFQAVTHTVRSELAFGLENLGLDSAAIRMRIAETASYFGLDGLFDRKLSTLSGGKLQLVCLAGIVAMHPRAVLLDEPLSQLDPMVCDSLMGTLKRLSVENAITVIVSEHRLEKVLPVADRILVMDCGRLTVDTRPDQIRTKMLESNSFLDAAVPSSARIIARLGLNPAAALTVRDAKRQLDGIVDENAVYKRIERTGKEKHGDETAVDMKNVSFGYDETKRVLNGLNLKIRKNSFFCLMGANAAGKTTVLMLMGGLLKAGEGRIKLFGKNIGKYGHQQLYNGLVAVLPQKVHTLFAGNTVKEDLMRVLDGQSLSADEKQRLFDEAVDFFSLRALLPKHPYDISQGEMQRAAFCMALLRRPKLLLLDEPTKGMDALFKKELGEKIRLLVRNGMTVVAVSHDSEFCAEYGDECAFICDGVCSEAREKGEFFSGNFFFTTEANKISRHVFENAVTESEVLMLCRKNQENR